jgi:hypothetical protein
VTDIVGSTALRVAVGEERTNVIAPEHTYIRRRTRGSRRRAAEPVRAAAAGRLR